MKNNVLVLFCGGTIVMAEGDNGILCPQQADPQKMLNDIEPRLKDIARFSLHYVANMDSTNMEPSHWDTIISAIKDNYDRYDGFIITHGTDTMAYTAAALNVAIRNLGKPIVLTGSQIPGKRIDTDARRNLVNAFKVAAMNIAGVFLVFDERIIHGGRATKDSESKLDAFTTVNDNDAGEIRVEIKISNNIRRKKLNSRVEFFPGFESDIFVYTLTPGCDPSDLEYLLDSKKIKGIIIRAYGTGNLPDRFSDFFGKAAERKLPIVVSSQCLHGITQMHSYEVGQKALENNVIEGFDQSLETLVVKLMWAIKHRSFEQIKEVIHTNFSHELKMENKIKIMNN